MLVERSRPSLASSLAAIWLWPRPYAACFFIARSFWNIGCDRIDLSAPLAWSYLE